jgi:hypothetical protein
MKISRHVDNRYGKVMLKVRAHVGGKQQHVGAFEDNPQGLKDGKDALARVLAAGLFTTS